MKNRLGQFGRFFVLSLFCCFLLQAQAVVDGFSLDQYSFTADHSGNVPCSEYGHAGFAVRQTPGQVQYIQVMAQLAGSSTAPAWVVRNVPATATVAVASTGVDLTQLGVKRGTCITGSKVAYNITVTDGRISTAPAFTGSLTTFAGQRINHAEGLIPPVPFTPGSLAAPDAPLQAQRSTPLAAAGDLNITINERQGIGSIVQGMNECGPGGVTNSMYWLQSMGSINLGTDTTAQSLSKLKSDMIPAGWRGNGVYPKELIEGKLRFTQRAEHPLNMEIHYQADSTYSTALMGLGASVTVGTGTANRDGAAAPPTFDYIKQEMAKGQDVELGLVWLDNANPPNIQGGHVVTVSGTASGPDGNALAFNDDSKQDGTANGLRFNHWVDMMTDGGYPRLGGGESRNRIAWVFSESPKPVYFTFIPLEETNQIDIYMINPFGFDPNPEIRRSTASTPGGLTPVPGTPFSAGNTSVAAATAMGKFLYVANYGSNNVSGYVINPTTGVPTNIPGQPFNTGQQPFSITTSGRFVYVGNSGAPTISAFTIDPITGTLSAIAGSPFFANSSPNKLAVSPSGRLLFAANNSSTVSVFVIDPVSGALTAAPGSPFAAGSTPNSVAVHASGQFVYVANQSPGAPSGTISAYSIAATGALTPIAGSPFTVGAGPADIAIDPAGKFMYVAIANGVAAYSINAGTGALTAVSGSPYTIPTGGFSVVVDPTGQYVYVTSQIQFGPGAVSLFSINPSTGALTGIPGTINTTAGPARMTVGAFGPAQTTTNPAPAITQLAPSVAKSGAATQVLSVFGSNFVPGAVVRWNGSARATAFISSGQLNAAILATDQAAAGTAQVTVQNPTPGGGTSSSLAFTISATGAGPVFPSGGAVNAGGFQAGMAVVPGSIAAAFGTSLAASTTAASLLPLPTSLGNSSMTFNGTINAPLFFTSAGQMNVQIPWELAGQSRASVTVTSAGASSTPSTVTLAPFGPGVFTLNNAGTGQGAILIANSADFAAPSGSISGASSRPVKAGEFITIYCTGLGDVSNRPASGTAASGTTLSLTSTNPTVTIGGVAAPVNFSGLAPGFVGLYQVNAQVPSVSASNSVPVVLTIGGMSANTVTIAVQ